MDGVAGKFRSQLVEFLDLVIELIDDLNAAGYTDSTSMMTQIMRDQIAVKPPAELVNLFKTKRDAWVHIQKKNNHFMLVELPKLISTTEFDASALTIPLRVYLDTTTDQDVVDADHIEDMWTYLGNMVKLATQFESN
jgi:hypothetical protein